MRKKYLMITFLLIAVIIIFAGCSISQPSEKSQSTKEKKEVSSNQVPFGDMKNLVSFGYISSSLIINAPVRKLVCGDFNSFVLLKNGDLYATGSNGSGQFGTGSRTKLTSWECIDNSVGTMAAGDVHCLKMDYSGNIYGAGDNIFGKLGLGDKRIINPWEWNGSDVQAVACGHSFSLLLMNYGHLNVTGLNDEGQFGIGVDPDITNSWINNDVPGKVIIKIACGNDFSFALASDGNLYATGDNSNGQLGIGKDDTNAYTWTWTASDVKDVACGYYHTLILKTDGTIYGAGSNIYGQLAVPSVGHSNTWVPNGYGVEAIACGAYHSIVLCTGGTICGAGHNDTGQLGLLGSWDRTNWEVNGTNVIAIACGNFHSLALCEGGTYGVLCVTGANFNGQLGLGDTNDRLQWTLVP